MKNVTLLSAAILATSLLIGGCNQNSNGNNGTSTPTANATASPLMPSPVTVLLPENWQWLTNDFSNFSIGYPSDWFTYLPDSETGETAMYSYDLNTVEGTEGVPTDELKVAVMHFSPARASIYEPPVESAMTASEVVTVAGQEVMKKTFDTSFGLIEQVEIRKDDHIYVISAYPANSEKIDVYDQMLQTFTIE